MSTHAYRRSALLLVVALVVLVVGSFDVSRHVRAAPIGTTVSRWQTSQAGDRLTAKANLSFAADDNAVVEPWRRCCRAWIDTSDRRG
jgi:hypothetical protein